jgi:hypothetical protein
MQLFRREIKNKFDVSFFLTPQRIVAVQRRLDIVVAKKYIGPISR